MSIATPWNGNEEEKLLNIQFIQPKLANTRQKPPRTASQACNPPFGGSTGFEGVPDFSMSVEGISGTEGSDEDAGLNMVLRGSVDSFMAMAISLVLGWKIDDLRG